MYYVYERSSTLIMGKPHRGVVRPDHRCSYKTMAAAKAALTRICTAEGLLPTDPNYGLYRYACAEAQYFHTTIEKTVRRKVLEGFGGKEYEEPVNTPNYMSPASETYWSM